MTKIAVAVVRELASKNLWKSCKNCHYRTTGSVWGEPGCRAPENKDIGFIDVVTNDHPVLAATAREARSRAELCGIPGNWFTADISTRFPPLRGESTNVITTLRNRLLKNTKPEDL